MKKIFSALALLILISAPAFALSDAEYLKMKKNNQSFARADRKLTNVWNKLKKSLPEYAFEELQKNQREWLKSGRDYAANAYIKEGYSRTEAYTFATNDRANKLPDIAAQIENENDVQTEPGFPLDEDDRRGEIEENRFQNSESDGIVYEGNYTRRTAGSRGGFMTVLIVDKNSNEAEVTISIKNPEATWTARGWINEDNSLELFDSNYSSCQANLTFSKNRVRIETSPEDDWDEILGEGSRLDGVYDKN